MTKAWDSVDNRMGQLVYDNLFWNKTLKDLAFISTRSVGWNLGSVREIGGGGVDAVKAVADMARGRKPELTTRMAYTIAMPIITALYGAILTLYAHDLAKGRRIWWITSGILLRALKPSLVSKTGLRCPDIAKT